MVSFHDTDRCSAFCSSSIPYIPLPYSFPLSDQFHAAATSTTSDSTTITATVSDAAPVAATVVELIASGSTVAITTPTTIIATVPDAVPVAATVVELIASGSPAATTIPTPNLFHLHERDCDNTDAASVALPISLSSSSRHLILPS